jgi:hypothetical protein
MTAWIAAALLWPQADRMTVRPPTDEEVRKIDAAAPDRPSVAPGKPRRLLVLGHRAAHFPTAFCEKAMLSLARKTGAFEATVSDDGGMLEPEKLAAFDAILVNNWHGWDPFLGASRKEFAAAPAGTQAEWKAREARRRKSLLDFVAGGKGLAGIHAAAVGFNDWPEWGDLLGGRYQALPYFEAPVAVVDPSHPVTAAFGGAGFRLPDEFYELREPYSHRKVRLLLAVDWPKMKDAPKSTTYGKPVRTDGDYGLSWVKAWGRGRVFYCALGHYAETYWNPAMLRHFLDGIQFALGDLPADTTPTEKLPW